MEKSPINNRTEMLSEASMLVNGDRNVDYGDPIDDFKTTAKLWETYLQRIMSARKYEDTIMLDPHDVAVMMELLKIARVSWSPTKRDHWVDMAGYAACGWDCVERTYNAD